MQGLPRVFFQVHADDAERAQLRAGVEGDSAFRRQGELVLRDLIALGKVRIEVVLPGENGLLVDLAAERQGRSNGQLHGAAIQDRKRARQPEADGTQLGVGFGTEAGAAAAEDFSGREELGVNLQADDGLERGHGWEIVP